MRHRNIDLVDRIIAARNPASLGLLLEQDLVPAFQRRLEDGRVEEMDFISRVWEMRGTPVPLGPFSAKSDLAFLRIHTLNQQQMEGDAALLPCIATWAESDATVLVSLCRLG